MTALGEILKIGLLRDLKIITGEYHLDIPVKTVTVMEVPEVIRYLKGSDFLITSLYAIHDDEDKQCQLVMDLAKEDASCLAIKLGKYANKISEKMIAVAKKNNFVLLEIPANITYIDIIMAVMQYILTDTNRGEIVSKYINDILLEAYSDEQLMLQRGRFLGLDTDAHTFSCLVFDPKSPKLKKAEERAYKVLASNWCVALKDHFPNIEFFLCDFADKHIILMASKHKEELSDIFHFVCNSAKDFTSKLLPQTEYSIGLGLSYKAFSGIRQSFLEASQAIKIGRLIEPEVNIFSYTDMEIYINLSDMFYKTNSSLFDKKLGKINNNELLDTLKAYIECDNNIEKTAKRLFTHKNTINYRLNKIKEICDLDVRKQKDNFLIYLMLLEKKLIG